MKKLSIAVLLATLGLPAFAQSGGFHGGETPPPPDKVGSGVRGVVDARESSVKDAKNMRDNNWVTLEGHIEKEVGDQQYLFRDKTGTIMLKINRNIWNNQDVTAKDLISVSGNIKRSPQGVLVDVGHLLKQ